jgi:hypothetical protein
LENDVEAALDRPMVQDVVQVTVRPDGIMFKTLK